MTRFRLALASLLLPALATAQAPAHPAAPAAAPRLVVFITVDQFRPDYLDRFAPQLTGGLARLYRHGAVFTNGFQDHAITETAPGHATTMSGRFPVHTGIVRNTAGVNDPASPLIGGGGDGASPFRFRGSVLFDWMRTRDPASRALSISRKDRGAILPLGRAEQEVYWYAPGTGAMTTSTYYHDTLPDWVQRFDARRVPQRMAGQAWTLLLPDSAYHEPDSVAAESGGRGYTFPHVLPQDTAAAVQQFLEFPWMDQLLLDMALDGIDAMQLGTGPHTDLLAVSLSTTDAVGHRYGPDSREIHDQVLRLDRSLGAFLDSLYKLRDSSSVVIALTADHGVAPLPELQGPKTHTVLRRVSLAPLARATRSSLQARGVDASAFALDGAVLFVDRAAFARAGVNADSTIDAFARAARAVPGVRRVDRPGALAKTDTVHDAVSRRWVHMLPADLHPELVITLQPYDVWGSGLAAIHGSPYDYDAHVPIIFYGAPFRPGRYAAFARVVDMAPTLARVVGVEPTEKIDGRVLVQALR